MNVKLLAIPLTALIALAGCAGDKAKIEVRLAEGERAYADKRYDAAIQALSSVVSESKDPALAARALYVRGMARAAVNQRVPAYSDLGRAAETGDKETRWRALSVLGVMQFEDRNWDAAAQTLERAIAAAPDRAPEDALLFRLGLCQERSGRWSQALRTFGQLVERYPAGTYAPLAKRRLELRAENFAVQCGVFEQEASAQRKVGELKQSGFDAYTRREVRGGRQMIVVLVGRFRDYDDAIRMLRRVKGYVPDAVLWP